MDRRFLSDEQVIKAARDFVCIRTATYEDQTEANYLKSLFLGRAGGDLRNFGFCILSPDGKRQLRRSNRGPNFVYTDSRAMAADLRQIAGQYVATPRDEQVNPAVPRMKSVRLGINVASCDGLPSIVVFGTGRREVDRMNATLRGVIWDTALAGKFIYSSTTKSSDLKIVVGATTKSGILVIEPDAYGLTGRLIKRIDARVSREELKSELVAAADSFTRRSKTHGLHVRNGRRSGKLWKTEVPVPHRVRGRGRAAPRRRRRE
ncbi:MAG: hypothetical protein CMJ75_03635 [Planctomycetaceae bacterium]|nr:hypothetical protein [Planctomycetaceae bacterium]